MVFQSTTVTLHFPPLNGIRENYFQNIHAIVGHFQEPTVLPIADNAPGEMPRIIVISKNGHSQLILTKTTATLNTAYDAGFEHDWGSCCAYLKAKMKVVRDFLVNLGVERFYFGGTSLNLLLDNVSCGPTPTLFLKDALLKEGPLGDLKDINIRYTFVTEEKYYINIQYSNVKSIGQDVNLSLPGALGALGEISESVGVTIETNDRYAFNEDRDYVSGEADFLATIDLITTTLNDKVSAILGKG